MNKQLVRLKVKLPLNVAKNKDVVNFLLFAFMVFLSFTFECSVLDEKLMRK